MATAFHALLKLARVVVFAGPLTFITTAHLRVEHAILVALHEIFVSHAAFAIMARESLNAVPATFHALTLPARVEFHAHLHALR
jgi:hypothetical protein